MMAMRFPTTDDSERQAAIDAATVAIRRGELVVLPKDTVNGMANDAFDDVGVARPLEAKGRGRDMPPPGLVSAATNLERTSVEDGREGSGGVDLERVRVDKK